MSVSCGGLVAPLEPRRMPSTAFTLHYKPEKHALEKFGPKLLGLGLGDVYEATLGHEQRARN